LATNNQQPTTYYITDRRALAPKPLLSRINEAIEAGIDLIQIREKDLATRPLLELAQSAVERARGSSTRIIVNDRLDVGLAAGASGVHLGTQSLPAGAARPVVPAEFLVGVSCHSVQDAVEAEAAGADYLLLSPIFATPSKATYGTPLGLAVLQQAVSQVSIPVYALGGIDVEKAKSCLNAGARGIAGISIFQNCPSLSERVQELTRIRKLNSISTLRPGERR